MNKTRVLVTGSAGFMGSHLVDALLEKGCEVYGADDMSGGYKDNINLNSIFEKIDLREKDKVNKFIEKIKPFYIFHLAADAAEGRSQFTPISSTGRNYVAYLNLLIPAIKNGLKKIIITSSMSIYGSQRPPFSEEMLRKPDDIYGIAKTAMEQATEILSKVYGFRYTIVRPHNVYGPRQNLADPYRNVVAIFINRLLGNKNFYIYGDGEQKRAFTYIDDFTPYLVKAGFQENCDGEIINLGPETEYTINQLAKTVLNIFFSGKIPKDMQPTYLPIRPQEVQNAWCTVGKAQKLLGYRQSVLLEDGIKEMIKWAKRVGNKSFKYIDELELTSNKTPVTWKEKLI